jgi:hypothetical protein
MKVKPACCHRNHGMALLEQNRIVHQESIQRSIKHVPQDPEAGIPFEENHHQLHHHLTAPCHHPQHQLLRALVS